MKAYFKLLAVLFFVLHASHSFGQNSYQYSVDLSKVENDQLKVTLLTPTVNKNEILFYFPVIVPGTYMNSNYGKYVHKLSAFDRKGNPLGITHPDDNGWLIKNAEQLYMITYLVEDTWDSKINNKVYSMAGTNFEAGKNFVLNTPGIFGYLDGMKKNNFQLTFTKPNGFYAATALTPVSSTSLTDVFLCSDADHLYDSPIMYSLPDTAVVKVGNTDVIVCVYSPRKMATASFIADHLKTLLMGAKDYLGGKLPINKYAFIFYFNGEQKKLEESGAWEHAYSSFYSLDEKPEKEGIAYWVDIAAHEFFHIVTPLTISSKEVKEFDFNNTRLSKHLWLYEGSTEYYSQNMQVWSGLKSPEAFLQNLAEKIFYSRTYFNDSLPFTTLSREAAGSQAQQYGNVYMKGAIISACIDLYLLDLSGAQYGLRQLKHDLGILYGKDKYFEDDSLFNVIGSLSYPQVTDFLDTYVSGGSPIPYEKYFALAGVDYIPLENYRDFSLGGLDLKPGENGSVIAGIKDMNALGKAMGYKDGDELISLNDLLVNVSNIADKIDELFSTLKEGDLLSVKVKRKDAKGKPTIFTLTAPAVKVEKARTHVLRFSINPTPAQLKLRNAWLNNHQAS